MAEGGDSVTTCSVCSKTFTDPHISYWNDELCRDCVDHDRYYPKLSQCPSCSSSYRSTIHEGVPLYKSLDITAALEASNLAMAAQQGSLIDIGNKDVNAKKCDLCETNEIAHWCEDCAQWMCDEICARMHLKSNASKSHVVVPIKDKKLTNKKSLELQVGRINEILDDFESAVEKCQGGVSDARNLQVATLKALEDNRADCHRVVDAKFDALKAEAIEYIAISANSFQSQLKETQDKIKEINKERINIQQTILFDSNTLAVDGAEIAQQTETYLQTVMPPAVDI